MKSMFKTNKNIEKTIGNILEILDGEYFEGIIQNIRKGCSVGVDITATRKNGKKMYYLFDYTFGVIESK